jgi:CHAT domain-containing protein
MRFFALQRDTPLVRYIAEPFAAQTLVAPRPVRILVAMAGPSDLPELKMDEEEQRIRQALAELGDQVSLTVLPNATAEKLHGALAHGYHVFHFIGHGTFVNNRGSLAFENASGQTQLLDADQLMFLIGNTGLKVVVLNACKTAEHGERDALMGVAPALVRAEIPAVVAMQFSVPDQTALGFTRDLYRFLAAGKPLDAAVTEMRIGAYIGAGDRYYWGIPVLFMRAPDGIIW